MKIRKNNKAGGTPKGCRPLCCADLRAGHLPQQRRRVGGKLRGERLADMLLTDLTQSDYKGRESALAEELADLSGPERQEICDVIEVMIRHAKQRKQ